MIIYYIYEIQLRKDMFKMGKKKKKKKNKIDDVMFMAQTNDKQKLSKDFRKALNEIESYRIRLAEADKKAKIKERRKINKASSEFYTDMESIKCRAKMAKEWEKTGFLDRTIQLLEQTAPIIKMVAKLIMALVITFLSIDAVKNKIKPETVNKISKVFHLAMSV